MTRIAFVGCAHIHMPSFVRMTVADPEIQTAYLWDKNPERAKKYAAELKSTAITDLSQIWNDKSVAAVVIASETIDHEKLIMEAVSAGKHIYVEKPLGFTGEDARRAAAAIRKAGLIFQTGYFNRGNSALRFLKKQIEAGNFGRITRMRFSNCHAGSLGGWFDTEWRWMADPAIAGCGAFGDLGTHALDIIMWFLGRPEKVTGQIRVVTGRYGQSCDETGEAILAFPDGALATIAAGWVDQMCPLKCEVSGTEGYAYLLGNQLFFKSTRVEGADGKEPWTDLPDALPHAFALYLQAVRGQQVPLVSPEEAADRSVVMGAIYDAARDGDWKTIRNR